MSKAMQNKKLSPYNRKGRFYNHEQEKLEGVFFRSLHMFVHSLKQRIFKPDLNIEHWFVQHVLSHQSIQPRITWIGHATFLIQIGSINILTDPIFGDASLLFRRIFKPGISIQDLPPIDYVIISHNHRDHMDSKSLLQLKKFNPTVLVPHGNKGWFEQKGFKVIEHFWWEQNSFSLGDATVQFTFLPAYHWSQRGVLDRNKTLWGSWMIECNGYKIYFAGDTAFSDHFKAIGNEFSAIDLALMPIGPCEPRYWMKHSHMSAHEAVEAFLQLNARSFIPMHWGTFYFGIDAFIHPIEALEKGWSSLKTHNKILHIMKIGQHIHIDP